MTSVRFELSIYWSVVRHANHNTKWAGFEWEAQKCIPGSHAWLVVVEFSINSNRDTYYCVLVAGFQTSQFRDRSREVLKQADTGIYGNIAVSNEDAAWFRRHQIQDPDENSDRYPVEIRSLTKNYLIHFLLWKITM